MADMTMPFDLEVQNQDLERKRALAQALMGRALGPQPQGQMVSGHYVAPGIGSAIAQIGTAMLGNYANDKANSAQSELAGQRQKQLTEGLNSYLDTRSGKPGQTMSTAQASDLMNNDQAPQLAEPVAADPRKAIVTAMASRMPELQAIGKADFAALNKQQQGEVKDINGQAVLTFTDGRPSQLLGDYRSPMAVNSQLVAPGIPADGAKPKVLGDYRDKFGPVGAVAQPPGQPAIYGQTQPDTGEVKFAPGGSTFSPDKTGNLEALQGAGKVLGSAREQFMEAKTGLAEAQRILQLSQDPSVTTGFAASPTVGLQSLTAKLGFGGSDGLAKTQELVAGLSRRTLEAGKLMKGSFSDKDIAFLKDVEAGKIELTPTVLQHAAGLSVMSQHNAMLTAREQHNSARTVTGADEIAKLYPLPPFGSHSLDESMFPASDDSGRVGFNSPLFSGGAAAKKGTAQNPMTYEEYMSGKK